MKTQEYLLYLKKQYNRLTDDIEKSVFYLTCKKYQSFKQGLADNKQVTKESIILDLIEKNILHYKKDGSLPDDRPIRQAARELLKKGYPIVADSTTKGYSIVEKISEVDLPQQQNYDRAINILAVNKGYNKIRIMLGGQEEFKELG